MSNQSGLLRYVTHDKLFEGAEPSTAFEEARKSYLAQIESEGPIDIVTQRELEDLNWVYNHPF